MERADTRSRTGKRSLNLHEATGIARNHGGRTSPLNGIDFGARHGAREFGEFHCEGAAEAAAFLSRRHLAQLQSPDVGEQAARCVFHAQFAQSVAAIVKSNDAVEARADIFHARHLGEVRGEFVDAAFQGMHARQRLRLLLEQF